MANKQSNNIFSSAFWFGKLRNVFTNALAKEIAMASPKFNSINLDFMNDPRTSSEYFEKYHNRIILGSARSVTQLFKDHYFEKDFWSKWIHLLKDRNNFEFVEQWSDMTLEVLKKANAQWGITRFSPGTLFENTNPNHNHNPSNPNLLVAWSDSSLTRLYRGMCNGKAVFPDYYFPVDSQGRFMVVSEHITLFEIDKNWQRFSANPMYKLIPDYWFFRVVECLVWIENESAHSSKPGTKLEADSDKLRKVYLLLDPDWGLHDLVKNGFAKEFHHDNVL